MKNIFCSYLSSFAEEAEDQSQDSTERWLPSDLIHQFRIECEIWALIGILNINTCINSTR